MNVKIARVYLTIQNYGYISNFIIKSQVFLRVQTIYENTKTFYLHNKLIDFAVICFIEAFILHPGALYRNTNTSQFNL